MSKLPKSIITGRVGEQYSRVVQLDVSEEMEQFPGTGPVLLYRRPGEDTLYPGTITFNPDTNIIEWVIDGAVTAVAGADGAVQIMFSRNDNNMTIIGRSFIIRLSVLESLTNPDSEPPDAYETWLENLTTLAAQTQGNAASAQQSASSASASATAASGYAASAQQAVADAQSVVQDISVDYEALDQAVSSAASSADLASGSADAASASAGSASSAATSAMNDALLAGTSANAAREAADEAADTITEIRQEAEAAAASASDADSSAEAALKARDQLFNSTARCTVNDRGYVAVDLIEEDDHKVFLFELSRGPEGKKGDKGDTGEKGNTGAAAGFATPTASVDSNVGTPSVEVTASGPDTAKVFDFQFHNMKGEKGDTGDPTSATAEDIPMSSTDDTTIAEKVSTDSETTSGNPITVETESAQIAEKTVVHLEPKQDLHGYDHPWPAGGGKNKAPMMQSATNRGITVTVGDDGVVTANGTNTAGEVGTIGWSEYVMLKAGSYILSGSTSANTGVTIQAVKKVDNTVSNITRDSDGNGRTFTLEEDTLVGVRGFISADANVSDLKLYPMIRLASETDATYEPYSNICTIEGFDGVEVKRTGEDSIEEVFTFQFPTEAGTVYGGTLTIEKDGSGTLVVDSANIASCTGEALPGTWISDRDVYSAGATPTTGAQVVYELTTPLIYTLSAEQVTLLKGINHIFTDGTSLDLTARKGTFATLDDIADISALFKIIADDYEKTNEKLEELFNAIDTYGPQEETASEIAREILKSGAYFKSMADATDIVKEDE